MITKVLRLGRIFLQGYLMLNLIWLVGYMCTNTTVIPNPLLVYKQFPSVFTERIVIHIYYSLYRIGFGLFLSLLIGIPIGMLMAYSKKANSILYPLIYFTYPIPKTALLPIAMLLLGMNILFFVEGYGTKYGMGYYILDAWSRIQYTEMYIGIIVISVVGFLLFVLIDVLSESLCKWSTGKVNL